MYLSVAKGSLLTCCFGDLVFLYAYTYNSIDAYGACLLREEFQFQYEGGWCLNVFGEGKNKGLYLVVIVIV